MNQQLNFGFDEENESPHYLPEDHLVLSLQPYAFDLIFSGEKTMEYRTRFRKKPARVFVYVSTPEKCIKGMMELGTPILGTAKEISKIAEEHRPGNGAAVYDYLAKGNRGYAIPIKSIQKFEPVSLETLREQFGFRAPQSYQSLGNHPELLEFLLGKVEVTSG